MKCLIKYFFWGCCSIASKDPMAEPINPQPNNDELSVCVTAENSEPIIYSLYLYDENGELVDCQPFILMYTDQSATVGFHTFFDIINTHVNPLYKMNCIEDFIKKNKNSTDPIKRNLCALVREEYLRLARLELFDNNTFLDAERE